MVKDDFTRFLDKFCKVKDYVEAFEKNSDVGDYLFRIYVDEKKLFSRPVSVTLSENDLIIAFSVIGTCPTDEWVLWKLLEENKDGHYSKLFIMGENLVRGVLFPIEFITPEIFAGTIMEIAERSYYYLNKYF